MTKQHTPGPWATKKSIAAPEIIATSRRIAKVFYEGGSEDCEVDANARLIAAAPDMLDALYYVIGAADRSSEVYSKARQAIDKATKP